MHAHLTQDPPRPSAQQTGVSTGFDNVIARGMAKDPDRRYQTAAELAVAARQVIDHGVPPAAQPLRRVVPERRATA